MHKSLLLITALGLSLSLQTTPPSKYPIGDWPLTWHPSYPIDRFEHVSGAPRYLEVIITIEAQTAIAQRDRRAVLYAQQALIAAAQAAPAAQEALPYSSQPNPKGMDR